MEGPLQAQASSDVGVAPLTPLYREGDQPEGLGDSGWGAMQRAGSLGMSTPMSDLGWASGLPTVKWAQRMSGQGFSRGPPGTVEGPNLSQCHLFPCCPFPGPQPRKGPKKRFPLGESGSQFTHSLCSNPPRPGLPTQSTCQPPGLCSSCFPGRDVSRERAQVCTCVWCVHTYICGVQTDVFMLQSWKMRPRETRWTV